MQARDAASGHGSDTKRSGVVAALFVDPKGVYADLPGVDLWDEECDARLYAGPWPVVAHPPCNHWCQLASVNAARYESFEIGDDGGCFEAALAAVRRFGGVLEHPAYSLAWFEFGLPVPGHGGWTQAIDDPGWTTAVSQVAYGHDARKRTWLYAVGCDLPALDWSEPVARGQVGIGPHRGNKALRLQHGRSCHYENLPTHFQGEHWVWGRLDYRATKADVANGLRWHERLTVGSRRYQSLYGAEAWVVIRDRYWGGKMYMDLPTRHDGWGTVYRGQPRQGITVCGKRYVEWPDGNRTYPTITTHFKPYFAPTTTTTATTGTPT